MVTTFAMIGSGFRAGLLMEVARELEAVSCVGVVTRTPRSLPVPAFRTLDELLAEHRVDFVMTATKSSETPAAVEDAVRRGLPVLAETPPAVDLESLVALWSSVGESGLVQVAEQYLMMPTHAARAALVRSGVIGTPTQVQVSSTQLYHAVSLIRGLVGAGRAPVTARATRFVAPLQSPLGRAGWTDDDQEHPATTTIATLDLGEGRSGVYDFTDQQTRNQLRFRRLTVRGSAGELQDDQVVRMTGPRTLLTTPIVRRQTGHDLDLNGYDTEHLSFGSDVLWANPYVGRRWNDDEIAMAVLLDAMAAWTRGEGPEPYPLADGCHDHQVALAIEASADTDQPVMTVPAPWTDSPR